MSSYNLPTGDSTNPISLPSHHSTPPPVETPAVTEIHMLIRVTGYIPSKSAKPVKSLNDVLKHQKPERGPPYRTCNNAAPASPSRVYFSAITVSSKIHCPSSQLG